MSGATLLVGATGFIGRHLRRVLLAEGYEVVLAVRGRTPIPDDWEKDHEILRLHGDSNSGLAEASRGRRLASIINCAAYGVSPSDRDFDAMMAVNVELPLRLVGWAAEADAAYVHVGSCSEYAPPVQREPLTERSPAELAKLYGTTKFVGGVMANLRAATMGVQAAVLRLFNVYGPYEAPHRLLPSILEGSVSGKPIDLSSGDQIRDFVHVDDVCQAVMRTAQALLNGALPPCQAFNISTGTGTSVRQFAEMAIDAAGAERKLLRFGALPMRPDDVAYLVGDNSLFEKAIGWRPGIGLEAGIADVVRLTRGHYRR